MKYVIVIGKADTREVLDVVGPVTSPRRISAVRVEWDGGSLDTDHRIAIVPASQAPEVGDTWTPPSNEADEPFMDIDRLRDILKSARDRVVTLEDRQGQLIAAVQALRRRVDALEGS